jgi:hypothetical protein
MSIGSPVRDAAAFGVASLLLMGCSHTWGALESIDKEAPYGATVAACINQGNVDPDACEQRTGPGQMNVDEDDGMTNLPNFAFLRFDLDAKLTGKTVDLVRLRLVVASGDKASSPRGGEVWQVAPFTASDLTMAIPAKVGLAPVGAGKDAVTQGEPVDWVLPPALAQPNTSLFLGVFPQTDDGVSYWNSKGEEPPKLLVDYRDP